LRYRNSMLKFAEQLAESEKLPSDALLSAYANTHLNKAEEESAVQSGCSTTIQALKSTTAHSERIIPTKYLSFNEAQKYVHKLDLPHVRAWRDYCRHGHCPPNVPHNPDIAYKNNGWTSWTDWLEGEPLNDNLWDTMTADAPTYLPFQDARRIVREQNLTKREWSIWSNEDKELGICHRPQNIPKDPARVYKNSGWGGWDDWLGRSSHNNSTDFKKTVLSSFGYQVKKYDWDKVKASSQKQSQKHVPDWYGPAHVAHVREYYIEKSKTQKRWRETDEAKLNTKWIELYTSSENREELEKVKKEAWEELSEEQQNEMINNQMWELLPPVVPETLMHVEAARHYHHRPQHFLGSHLYRLKRQKVTNFVKEEPKDARWAKSRWKRMVAEQAKGGTALVEFVEGRYDALSDEAKTQLRNEIHEKCLGVGIRGMKTLDAMPSQRPIPLYKCMRRLTNSNGKADPLGEFEEERDAALAYDLVQMIIAPDTCMQISKDGIPKLNVLYEQRTPPEALQELGHLLRDKIFRVEDQSKDTQQKLSKKEKQRIKDIEEGSWHTLQHLAGVVEARTGEKPVISGLTDEQRQMMVGGPEVVVVPVPEKKRSRMSYMSNIRTLKRRSEGEAGKTVSKVYYVNQTTCKTAVKIGPFEKAEEAIEVSDLLRVAAVGVPGMGSSGLEKVCAQLRVAKPQQPIEARMRLGEIFRGMQEQLAEGETLMFCPEAVLELYSSIPAQDNPGQTADFEDSLVSEERGAGDESLREETKEETVGEVGREWRRGEDVFEKQNEAFEHAIGYNRNKNEYAVMQSAVA